MEIKPQKTVANKASLIIKKEWFIQSRDGNIDDYYQTTSKKTLGSGTYGSVIKVKVKDSNQCRAIKIIPKKKVKDPQRFQNEINIMRTLDHPNIIKLYETFEDARNVYLVMELCEGGELFDRIIEKQHFSEKEAREIFKQIAQGLAHCHANHICHRDLKPENFLLLNKSDSSPIKIIDFGLSHIFEEQKEGQFNKIQMTTRAGTPYYIAPEVLAGKYDEMSDVWSLGVILFILLSGLPPFYGKNDAEILDMVKQRKYSLDIPEFSQVSEGAKSLIKRLLVPAEQRPKTASILDDPWLKVDIKENTLKINYKQFQNFQKHHKLKKVALTYIASQLSESEISDLGKIFLATDRNNDGVLSIDEIKQALGKLDNVQSKELEQILASIDTDGSGSINYTEFLAATIDKSIYLKEEKLYQAFKMLDLDKSGKISKDELKKILGTHEDFKDKDDKYWEMMIQDADKNGDGEIDYTEFVEMMKHNSVI